MHIIQDNPHLDALIYSLYQELLEGAPVELQIRRATELGMDLDEYHEWLREFSLLPRKEQEEYASMIVQGYITKRVSTALYAKLKTPRNSK